MLAIYTTCPPAHLAFYSPWTDPRIGKAAGFGGVILHGLSSYGFAARAVVEAVGGNDPASLVYFGVRFSSPVKPGDALETRMWEVGKRHDGAIEVAFEVTNLTTGKVGVELDLSRQSLLSFDIRYPRCVFPAVWRG